MQEAFKNPSAQATPWDNGIKIFGGGTREAAFCLIPQMISMYSKVETGAVRGLF